MLKYFKTILETKDKKSKANISTLKEIYRYKSINDLWEIANIQRNKLLDLIDIKKFKKEFEILLSLYKPQS